MQELSLPENQTGATAAPAIISAQRSVCREWLWPLSAMRCPVTQECKRLDIGRVSEYSGTNFVNVDKYDGHLIYVAAQELQYDDGASAGWYAVASIFRGAYSGSLSVPVSATEPYFDTENEARAGALHAAKQHIDMGRHSDLNGMPLREHERQSDGWPDSNT